MQRMLPIGLAVALLAGAGLVEFVRIGRAADPERAKVIQAKLDAIPLKFGGWVGQPHEVTEKQVRRTEASGTVSRLYTRPGTDDTVSVLLLGGDPGPLGAHDTERCYTGAGLRPVGVRQQKSFDVPGHGPVSLWTCRFQAESFPPTALQLYWGWGKDGDWAAAEDARYEFLGAGTIYKLYVQRMLPPAGAANAKDPVAEFLTDFLPEVRRSLTAAVR